MVKMEKKWKKKTQKAAYLESTNGFNYYMSKNRNIIRKLLKATISD